MNQTKEKKKRLNLGRALRNNAYMLGLIIKACPGVLFLSLLATVLGAAESFLMNTYMYQYALNALQEGKALKTVLITLAAMFAYSVANIIFQCASGYYFEIKYPIVSAYIQELLQKKAASVDLMCFESSDFYDVYVKATSEATDRAYTVMNNILDAVWVLINFSATAVLVLSIDPSFLIFGLFPFICTLFIGKTRNRIKYDYSMRNKEAARQRDYARRTFYLSDFSKEMRLTEMWRVMFARMRSGIAEMKAIVKKYGYKMMLFRYIFDLIFDVVVYTGAVILAAFKTLVSKTMLLGDCYVVINSITNIAYDLNYMGELFFKLDENSLYVDNLREFLEYEVRIAEDEKAPSVPAFEKLELRKASFSYGGQSAPALSDVSLTVKAGEKIAIVGHNGAGKTTLVKLLMRLYDPSEGEILLNGVDIKNYRLSSYRALFGTVFQDYRLFAVTVAENVMLRGGITDIDRAAVDTALARAGIRDKVAALPKGVDNVVTKEFDSDGAMFSGGEAQKISIARIFAGGHEIVIMDEPTSALDPIAEQEMYNNMFEACVGKTVIFISHRLSSAAMADRVYLFENGAIAEQGTHSALLAAGGKYADMWHKQADTYADAEEVA